MSESIKTLLFVAMAAGLLLLAYSAGPGEKEPAFFDDEGELFFPQFTKWDQASALEVYEYDQESSQLDVFKVENNGGNWIIPSHDNYPADAQQQMAKAATLVIGLRKQAIRSDRQEDHEALGVVDPTTGKTQGTGMLVKFSDSAGNALASLIIGNSVDGKPTQKFVRNPVNNRTYIAELNVDLSTSFKDWIETDLLQLAGVDIASVVLDYYSVDENEGRIIPGDVITATKEENDWIVPGIGDDMEVDQTPMSTLAATLDNLKIVGVRAKPAGISARLAVTGGVSADLGTQLALQSKGYFIGNNGQIISNEGDMKVRTNKGVEYTLRFGEIIYGDADEVSSSEADQNGEANANGEGEAESRGTANRYLMVTVDFKPSLLAKPEGIPLSQEQLTQRSKARQALDRMATAVRAHKANSETFPGALTELLSADPPLLTEIPKDPWGNDYVYQVNDDGFQIISYAADGNVGGEGVNEDISSADFVREDAIAKLAQLHRDYQDKVEAGMKEQRLLQQRFAPWYYVIDDASYQKLHLGRDQIVKPKTEDDK